MIHYLLAGAFALALALPAAPASITAAPADFLAKMSAAKPGDARLLVRTTRPKGGLGVWWVAPTSNRVDTLERALRPV